ncbi:MAG: recombinase family protein, partial [Sandaracinaceae bacterium]
RAEATRRGWSIAGEYVDHGISGAKDSRPELDRLMKDARAGRLDMVAVWRFDRFARSVRHLVTALDEFNARGIDFISLHDGIDTSTPVGRFAFHVVAAMSEMERELIRGRVRSGLAAARRRGTRLGRPKVYVDVYRALHLRAQGKSYRAVARALGVGATTLRRALRAHEEGRAPETPPGAGSQAPGTTEAA